mmetsp:Transcript_16777/g.29423  ORF Transcript_16777/g.29423 Transcript_16777/m.29423 type:complete len:518 (-) Transcript_16777:44-1597(-)
MVNCLVRVLRDPHTGALICLVAVVITTVLQFHYASLALNQANQVGANLAEKGLPDSTRRLDSLDQGKDHKPLDPADPADPARFREAFIGLRGSSAEDSVDKGEEHKPLDPANPARDEHVQSRQEVDDGKERKASDPETDEDKVPVWKRDRRVMWILIFYFGKAYVAIALTFASVFFLVFHDSAQYVGQLRAGPTCKTAHQAAGCLCGPRCGRRSEKHIQSAKVCVGSFHSWWNTGIGVFTFLLIHFTCPGGSNCLGAASVAGVAVATGLLKAVENFVQKARRDLNKFDEDVRHSAKLVETHPRHVSKLSLDSASAAGNLVSFLTEDHAKYASLGVLLASAENGFAAAFYSMGYCHQHILTPLVAKLNHSLEVEFHHFEEIAKEAIDEAALLFKFVRSSLKGIESAMHSLARRHADPADHSSILAALQHDLEKLDDMVGELAGVIEKYAPKILNAPKEGITALMDELEKIEVAGLHLFDRVFPEDRATPLCTWCSGSKYMKVSQDDSRTLSRTGSPTK